MNKQLVMKNIVLSTFGALVLFVLTAMFATQASAMPIEDSNKPIAAPVQLAYWHGYRYGYYHHGWWGRPRAYVCPRTCWRGYWGMLHCARRCY